MCLWVRRQLSLVSCLGAMHIVEPKASVRAAELLSWGTADFLSFASNFLTFKILWMRVCVCTCLMR